MEKRNVVITGASRGIGKTLADSFIKDGYNVAGLSRKPINQQPSPDFIPISADLTDDNSIQKAIEEIKSKMGNIDILINNAGQYEREALEQTSAEQIIQQTRLHVCSAVQLIKAFIDDMQRNHFGRIVNVSSAAAFLGSDSLSYSATKNALIGITRSIAKKYGQYGITANAIIPGPVETDMVKNMTEQRRHILTKDIPIGRFATREEITAPIRFLCSEEASYINGACIHVNGGLYMGD